MENVREMRASAGSCEARALNASKRRLRLTTARAMINDRCMYLFCEPRAFGRESRNQPIPRSKRKRTICGVRSRRAECSPETGEWRLPVAVQSGDGPEGDRMQERQQESVKDAPSAGDRPRARGEDQQYQAHRSFHRAQMNQQQGVCRLLLLRLRALRCDSSVRQLESMTLISRYFIPGGISI